MKKILILSGPTGVGKTDISIKLAKKMNGEIISADSMQIYKNMDVGSAKVLESEMQGIKHHMIDIIEPTESFTVSDFKERAMELVDDITSRGKLPIIVGGTGLYIDSLLCDYSFTEANKDETYRATLENMAKEMGKKYVHNLLKDIDIKSFENIHYNNLKRVIRALEVYKLTGKPFSEYKIEEKDKKTLYAFNYFVLTMDRDRLYERINQRVDIMFEKGLLEEVKKLNTMGLTSDMQSMKGIGYKEVLYYLDGKITIEEASNSIKQGSRNYAKRQLTWFRKNENVQWINKDDFADEDKIVDFIIEQSKR